ncbi:MAG: cytochrome c [Gammaproteobacteria bacterium]|nr:cytochrome c [Gammaproteobacteria bacterium]
MKRPLQLEKTRFIISLLGSGLLLSQTVMAETVIAKTTATEVGPARQSELIYFIRHDCGSCHGMTLKGGLGPALLPETLSGKPKDFLVMTILEGRPNTAMPPWKPMLSKNDAIWITEQLQNGSLQQTDIAHNKQTKKQTESQARNKTQ